MEVDFENLRDGLHPTFLHKTSLTKEVHFSFAEDFQEKNITKELELSDLSSFSADGESTNANASLRNAFEMIGNKDQYLNWLLFPYTHIVSPDAGALISVENYMPVSPEKTRLELRLADNQELG